jgi:hypothetical protein
LQRGGPILYAREEGWGGRPITGKRCIARSCVKQIIAQLEHDKTKHVLGTEPILVYRWPVRLVRVHEVTSMLSKGLEVLSLDLRESIVMVENGTDLLVIEYVASPDVYGEYWPIFDRLVTSVRFHDSPVM